MAKEKFQIEYFIKSSTRILYNRLSTASGLSEWFADDVKVSGNIFTFVWDGSEQKAEMISKKDQSFVKFKWLDEEDHTFFEFRIEVDDLTTDVILLITDFAEKDEIEDNQELWNAQISDLKQLIGN